MSEIHEKADVVENICQNIQNPERIVRQSALKDLQTFIQSRKENDDQLIFYYQHCYLYVFKCYSDKYEICRSLACLIINEFITRLPKNDSYLETTIPMIAKRIGQPEIIEESEEMRLELTEQLYLLVEKYKAVDKKEDPIMKSYNDLIDILIRTLRDPFPAVQKRACDVTVAMSREKCFHYRAESLVSPLLVMLSHRHSGNRIAAISALGHVSLRIYTSGECIGRIITGISPSIMDSMAHVRRECGRVGCLMLLKLRDRYSFFDKILPLVLCCLVDENEDVRREIDVLWIECGELYFKENEIELGKQLLIDHQAANYMTDVKRPTIGCRAIMQRSLRIVNVVLNEMEDWKEYVRLHSLKLLGQIVIHCEKTLTGLFMDIYPVLSKSCADPDSSISKEGLRVARTMGVLLDWDAWIDHALTGLEAHPRVGHLRCFTELYSGAGDQKFKDFTRIVQVIADCNFSLNVKTRIQDQLIEFLDILVDDLIKLRQQENVDDLKNVEKLLYQHLVQLISMSMLEREEIRQKGEITLKKLSNGELEVLHDTYLGEMINKIEGIDSLNSGSSEPILLLNGYIQFCGLRSAYFNNIKSSIKLVLEHSQPDGKVQILTALSIAILSWGNNEKENPDDDLLKTLIVEIIKPCLVWQVGQSAESIRTMATAILCSISENCVDQSKRLFPTIIMKDLIILIEDNAIATRSYALRCLLNCGEIRSEDVRALMLATVSRFDDPSGEVRELAARCVGNIKIQVDGDNSVWSGVLLHVLNISIHHFDDPDVRLRESIINSLEILVRENKDIFRELFKDKKFLSVKQLEALVKMVKQ